VRRRGPSSASGTGGPIGEGGDDERLLDNENLLTNEAGDAAHWMNIYRELIALTEDLRARLATDTRGRTPIVGHETVATDIAGLEEQLRHYRKRLDYWYARHWELRGLEIDAATSTIRHRGRSEHLSRREFQLLWIFLSYPSQTFAASELAQRAWIDRRASGAQVRIYIARLRYRLLVLGVPCHLVNQPRRGYCLVCE
jgi:DNA-binding response OmpR family regulator